MRAALQYIRVGGDDEILPTSNTPTVCLLWDGKDLLHITGPCTLLTWQQDH